MLLLIAIMIGAVALDQLTKWLAVVYLQGEPSFPFWKDVLHFTFVKNEGAAFGIFSDQRWVFMIFSTVAIIGLFIYLAFFRPKSKFVQITLALIIGGGIGNMIDRILLGYVIDFIDFTLINFAVFNVADTFITVGAFLLMGYLLIEIYRESKKTVSANNAEISDSTDENGSADSEDAQAPTETDTENDDDDRTGME